MGRRGMITSHPGPAPGTGCLVPGTGRGRGRPGRASERLGDRHPLGRRGALDVEAGVGQVPALRDQQAEAERGPGDPVGRAIRAPGPQLPGRAGQLDADGDTRRRAAMAGVAERARRDADVRDVPEPPAGLPLDAEGVGNVLPVRPGLHQPRGDRRREAHGRPEPGHAERRIEAGEDAEQPGPRDGEPVTQVVGPPVPVTGRDDLRVDAARRLDLCPVGDELGRVGRGHHHRLVEVRQVPDLVRDRPAGGRGRLPPAGVVKRRSERVEGGGLVRQVRQQRAEVSGHGRSPRRLPGEPGEGWFQW